MYIRQQGQTQAHKCKKKKNHINIENHKTYWEHESPEISLHVSWHSQLLQGFMFGFSWISGSSGDPDTNYCYLWCSLLWGCLTCYEIIYSGILSPVYSWDPYGIYTLLDAVWTWFAVIECFLFIQIPSVISSSNRSSNGTCLQLVEEFLFGKKLNKNHRNFAEEMTSLKKKRAHQQINLHLSQWALLPTKRVT